MIKSKPLKLFYSYSQKDEIFREELEEHLAILKRNSLLDDWHFRMIKPGEKWEDKTLGTLQSSDIILLLISSSFINSAYCYSKEMRIALNMHQEGKCQVIPIYIRPCNIKNAPFLYLQGLPKNLTPVSEWRNRDKAWTEISTRIENLCVTIHDNKENQSKFNRKPKNKVWSKMTRPLFEDLCKDLFNYYEDFLRKEKPSIIKLDYKVFFFKKELKSIDHNYLITENIDALLIFVNDDLKDIDRAAISMNLSSQNTELIIWDRFFITEKIEQHGILSFLYDLSFDSFDDYNQIINDKGGVNFVHSSNFINRKEELKKIERFIKNDLKSILTITGLPGIGKSVLANHSYYKNKNSFLDFCIIRFKKTTTRFDILHIINEVFLSLEIFDFNQIYSNSSFSDEVRLSTLLNILRKKRILFLFDNFEDYLENYKIKDLFISRVLEEILAFGTISKIIITSRVHPFIEFRKKSYGESIVLKPIRESVFYDEYLPSLPSLYDRIHIDGERSLKIEKELYKITGGVPLSLDLLEKYLNFLPIEGALTSSSEELEKIIVNDILNSLDAKYEKALIAIALFDDAIDYKFFKYFNLGNNDIELLINTGIIIYNSNHYKYLMHAFIRLILIKRYSKNIISELRKELINFLTESYSLDSYDSLNSLMIQKKKLELMINSEMYDNAAEHLGRISTRLISTNSVDYVEEYVLLIKEKVRKKSSNLWLLNVEAHILDFRKSFDKTISIYEKMYKESGNVNNIELEVLSKSNFATTYRRKGLFNKATSLYIPALENARKYQLLKLQGSILNNMGQNYIYNGQLIEAIECLEECIKIRTEMKDEFRLAATLTHYSSLCIRILEMWNIVAQEFQSYFSNDQSKKEFWLENALIKINSSIELQKRQKNFWLIERSYEQLSKYWFFKGNDRKMKIYESLAKRNRRLRGIQNDTKYN